MDKNNKEIENELEKLVSSRKCDKPVPYSSLVLP